MTSTVAVVTSQQRSFPVNMPELCYHSSETSQSDKVN